MFRDLSDQLPPLPFWMRMVHAGAHENLQYAFGGEGTAALVDPAWELERLVARVVEDGYAPRTALFTHAHWDHIQGAPWCAEQGMAVVVHEHVLDHPKVREAADIGTVRSIVDGERFEVGGVPVEVLATPGHQPEAVCYLVGARTGPRALFSGDTLFIGSCGRTDFPGGDTEAMFASMARIRALGEDVHVMPGHHYARHPCRALVDELQDNPALAVQEPEPFARLAFLRG